MADDGVGAAAEPESPVEKPAETAVDIAAKEAAEKKRLDDLFAAEFGGPKPAPKRKKKVGQSTKAKKKKKKVLLPFVFFSYSFFPCVQPLHARPHARTPALSVRFVYLPVCC